MNELAFNRWLLHTSRDWDDIKDILKRTNIPVIDQDHKQLARYALDLNLILEKIQRQEVTLSVLKEEKKTLKQFFEYTKEHFEREEKIINYFMLGNVEEQEQDHKQTLEKISDVVTNLEKGKIIFTQDQKTELLEWIIEHTNGLDLETLSLPSFKFFFNKVHNISQLRMFLNITGEPILDKEIELFFEKIIELNNSDAAPEKINVDTVQIYHQLEKAIFNTIDRFNLVLETDFKKIFSEFKPLDGLDLTKKTYRGELVLRSLIFVAENVARKIDILHWLPQYLSQCKSVKDLYCLVKPLGIADIDESFVKLLELTYNSYEAYLSKDSALAKQLISSLALQINQHFIVTEKSAKEMKVPFKKYQTETFKRLRIYLDKAFIHILGDRLEYSISLRNKVIFHCLSQNNFHDYTSFVYQPLNFLERGEAE